MDWTSIQILRTREIEDNAKEIVLKKGRLKSKNIYLKKFVEKHIWFSFIRNITSAENHSVINYSTVAVFQSRGPTDAWQTL